MTRNSSWVSTKMFIHCSRKCAIMAETRCGHTNMYHYFSIEQYSETGFTHDNWKEHHNPIVVLRNPLDRVVSSLPEGLLKAMPFTWQWSSDLIHELNDAFVSHTTPYMRNTLLGYNFRIIDFYDLEQYIPRMWEKHQSIRTDSRVEDHTVAEDVFIKNDTYTLRDLQEEVEIYNEIMTTYERVSVEEWKNLTR